MPRIATAPNGVAAIMADAELARSCQGVRGDRPRSTTSTGLGTSWVAKREPKRPCATPRSSKRSNTGRPTANDPPLGGERFTVRRRGSRNTLVGRSHLPARPGWLAPARENGVVTDPTELASLAFARGAWSEAFAQLNGRENLEQDDIERLAVTAYLVGETRASELAWERAQRLAASRGDAERGVRCAFWAGFDLLLRGSGLVPADGWRAPSGWRPTPVPVRRLASFSFRPSSPPSTAQGPERVRRPAGRGARPVTIIGCGDTLVWWP
jgi:hypothetical protein